MEVNLLDNESTIIKIMWFEPKYWQEDKWNTMNVPQSTQGCIKIIHDKGHLNKQLGKWNYSISNYDLIKRWLHSHCSLWIHEYSRWIRQLNGKKRQI